MRSLPLSILMGAFATLSYPAYAQVVGAQPDPRGEQVSTWGVPGPEVGRIELGLRALELNEFAQAEKIFAEIVRRERKGYSNFYMSVGNRPTRSAEDGEANFYLGVARMSLGKWEEAKEPLKVAVKRTSHPDPTSRLGVTYAKLGDIDGASAQRAALVAMNETCGNVCELSPFILQGIRMIDEAIAEDSSSSS
jgi:tetratricopeptide (TPR) repeat protein